MNKKIKSIFKKILKLLSISLGSIAIAFIILGTISHFTHEPNDNFFNKIPTASLFTFLFFFPATFVYHRYIKENIKSLKIALVVIGSLHTLLAILILLFKLSVLHFLLLLVGFMYVTISLLLKDTKKYFNVIIAGIIINLSIGILNILSLLFYQTINHTSFVEKLDNILMIFLFLMFYLFINIKIIKSVKNLPK